MDCTSVAAGFVFGKNKENYSDPIPHFCEHMLFLETEKYDKEALKNFRSSLFSFINAHTSYSSIILTFTRANKILEKCFDVGSEMLLNTKFSDENINSERNVIKQELSMAMANTERLFWLTNEETLGNKYTSPCAVLGTSQQLDAVTKEALQKFRDEVFVSENFVICVNGDIPHFKAKRLANKYFMSKLKSNPSYPVNKETQFYTDKPGNLNIKPSKNNLTSAEVNFKFDLSDEKNEQIFKILQVIAQKEISTRLRDKGLLYGSRFGSFMNKRISLKFNTSSENVNKILDVFGAYLNELKTKEIDQSLLDTVKDNLKYANLEKNSSPKENCARNLLDNYLNFGERYFHKKDAKRREKICEKITAQDIKNFAKDAFSNPNNLYITIMTDKKDYDFYTYEKMQDILTGKETAKQKIKPHKTGNKTNKK